MFELAYLFELRDVGTFGVECVSCQWSVVSECETVLQLHEVVRVGCGCMMLGGRFGVDCVRVFDGGHMYVASVSAATRSMCAVH